jgi:hypothetical protein
MQGEHGDTVVASQSVGETTCVNVTVDQFGWASILSNALQKNSLARLCRHAVEEFNLEIGPGQSIYCMTMARVQAEGTKTENPYIMALFVPRNARKKGQRPESD